LAENWLWEQKTMNARLQRRVQRYGWDLAADEYEPLWQAQLAEAQTALMDMASLAPGNRVLDVACGTGLVSFAAARAVGPDGYVLGVDLSGRMVTCAERRAENLQLLNCGFARMDAEALALPDASFDVALCALGLMYMPYPAQALREMRRVLRPGGRISLAVWGERSKCGWSVIFPIVDAEVSSEVCPLFFRLGQHDALARLCADAEFEAVEHCRLSTTLTFADAGEACDAAFVGGPIALAWSRFSELIRAKVRARYLDAIESWRDMRAYRIPGEFVIAGAIVPGRPLASRGWPVSTQLLKSIQGD
jgi:ubiquinone/menaquinone biosynthesis C-methylase UbiE